MAVWSLVGIIVAAAVYLIIDTMSHGPLFRAMFPFLASFFFYNKKVGKMLGIRYYRSDEWSTTRNESHLAVFGSSLSKPLLGLTFELGNLQKITALKLRQRKFTRPVNLAPYFRPLVGKKVSLAELEEFLVPIWVDELTDVYNIPLPVEKDRFAELIVLSRHLINHLSNKNFETVRFLWSNWSKLVELRSIIQQLTEPEALIMVTPFLTTVDSSLLNFSANPEPNKEFHELFQNTPVIFMPAITKSGCVILDLVANKANHPGNSVFGPKGLVCPGNTVTSMLMKSVADLKIQYRIEVEGKLKFKPNTTIKEIANRDEVFVTFHDRDPEELALLEEKLRRADEILLKDDQ